MWFETAALASLKTAVFAATNVIAALQASDYGLSISSIVEAKTDPRADTITLDLKEFVLH